MNTQTNQKLNEKYNEANYTDLAGDYEEILELFSEFTKDRIKYLSDIYRQEHTEHSNKLKIKEWKEELADLKDQKLGLESNVETLINSTKNEKVIHDVKQQLREVDERITILTKSLDKNKPGNVVRESMKYTTNKTHLAELDELAHKMGLWFETGVLGEGSVTYNEKTYTYPKN
jgi:hypothetical protein